MFKPIFIVLGAHSAVVNQKWTEHGREIKIMLFQNSRIGSHLRFTIKNMIYVPIDPQLLPIACQGVYNIAIKQVLLH